MLAKRIPSILPPLEPDEALEVTKIYSVAGMLGGKGLVSERPFREPHHTVSDVALVGGGAYPRPGEVSLAHRGVLFLDELPEYGKNTLDVLRQPLEGGTVTVSRSAHSVTFPADCMLVAAMNPCPCGYATDPRHTCVCSPGLIRRYRARLSGPLLDRIDLHINVPAVPYEELQGRGLACDVGPGCANECLLRGPYSKRVMRRFPIAGRMPICPAASLRSTAAWSAGKGFSAGSRAEAGAFRPRLYADLADKPDDCGSRRIGIHRRSPSGRGYRLPRAGQGSVLASALPSNGGGGLFRHQPSFKEHVMSFRLMDKAKAAG